MAMEISVGRPLVFGLMVLFGCGQSQQVKDLEAAAKELPKAILDAKVAGLLMSEADLEPKSQIPDSENAATGYRLAAEELGKVGQLRAQGDYWSSSLKHLGKGRLGTDEELQAARQFVAQAEKAFSHLDKAATKDRCDLRVPLSPALNSFPEYALLKELSKAAAIRVVVAAHDRDAAEVARALRGMTSMTRSLANGQSMIAQLVGLALGSIEMRAIEDALVESGADPAIVSVCRKAVGQMPATFSVEKAYEGECVSGLTLIQSLSGKDAISDLKDLGKLMSEDVAPKSEKVDPQLVRDALKAMSLKVHTKIRLALNGQKDTVAKAAALKMAVGSSGTDLVSKVVQVLTPVSQEYCAAIRKYELHREAALAGLKILQSHGKSYPAKIDATVLGTNLAYSRTKTGFRIDPIRFDIPLEKPPEARLLRFEYPRMSEPPRQVR